MKTTADKIAVQIKHLENDLEQQTRAVRAAKVGVAAAYIDGTGQRDALAKLATARDELVGMGEALKRLDQTWHETAVAEYQAGVVAINAEADASFMEASGALDKALESSVAPILRRFKIPANALEAFSNQVKDSAWAAFCAVSGERIQALGRSPKAPAERKLDLDPAVD